MRRRAAGFTLVEVLVALSIMAVLAVMAWQGIDAMARTRTVTQAAMERTLRLNTAMAQWERDLQALLDTKTVPPLGFDGATLRLTREVDRGVQMVAWSFRDGALWRWASPTATRTDELQEHWLRSQQLLGNEKGTLRVIGDATAVQLYFYRGNGWSNAQSAGAVQAPALPGAPAPPPDPLPTGVRLVLTLAGGALTRDIALSPQ
jgi:general secretion pathway protein J